MMKSNKSNKTGADAVEFKGDKIKKGIDTVLADTDFLKNLLQGSDQFPKAILVRNKNLKVALAEGQFASLLQSAWTNKFLKKESFKYLYTKDNQVSIHQLGRGFLIPVHKSLDFAEVLKGFKLAAEKLSKDPIKEKSKEKPIFFLIQEARGKPYACGRTVTISLKKIPRSIPVEKIVKDLQVFGTVISHKEKSNGLAVTFSEINKLLLALRYLYPEKKDSKWFYFSKQIATLARFDNVDKCMACDTIGHHHSVCPADWIPLKQEIYKELGIMPPFIPNPIFASIPVQGKDDEDDDKEKGPKKKKKTQKQKQNIPPKGNTKKSTKDNNQSKIAERTDLFLFPVLPDDKGADANAVRDGEVIELIRKEFKNLPNTLLDRILMKNYLIKLGELKSLDQNDIEAQVLEDKSFPTFTKQEESKFKTEMNVVSNIIDKDAIFMKDPGVQIWHILNYLGIIDSDLDSAQLQHKFDVDDIYR